MTDTPADEATEKTRSRGRPGNSGVAAEWYETELYNKLFETFPCYVQAGRLHVPTLADALGYSGQSLYRSLANGQLSNKIARKLVTLASKLRESDEDAATELSLGELLKYLPGMGDGA